MKSILVAVAVAAAGSGALQAVERIPRPDVPANIAVGPEFKLFAIGHAVGTQNYICASIAGGSGVEWRFIGPQATLFDAGMQTATHFQSMNPSRNNEIQATWQHSGDTSAVWATRFDGSLDSAYVATGAIEWLLLEVSGQVAGPTGGTKLSKARYIQRINTVGGVKPPAGQCTAATLNTRVLVPYQADYYFYQ
jgi:uncharacterized protein DUF3455